MQFMMFYGSLLVPLSSICCRRSVKGSLLAMAIHFTTLFGLYLLENPEDGGGDAPTLILLLNIVFFFVYLFFFASPRIGGEVHE